VVSGGLESASKSMLSHLPIWKRAFLHGFKSLILKHPGAVLSAVGSGIAYAGRETVQDLKARFTPERRSKQQGISKNKDLLNVEESAVAREETGTEPSPASQEEKADDEAAEFLRSLSEENRRALEELIELKARKRLEARGGSNSGD
jgi:hypothetical protein